MKKIITYFKTTFILSMLMVLFCDKYIAQNDSLFKAQDLIKEKKYNEAIILINTVVLNSETSTDPAAWHIRAFAYIQSYKQFGPRNTTHTQLLDSALNSALQSNKLDTKKEYKENNDPIIKNGINTFFNLAKLELLDSVNITASDAFYLKFRKYQLKSDPNFDIRNQDIEYYTALGNYYNNLFNNSNFNSVYGDKAKMALQKVLDIDPKNIKANMNLGILYYNQGATLINQMADDTEIVKLEVIQDNAAKLFKQSLPFMINVIELNPKDIKALDGLEGIYTALYDETNVLKIKQKKEALNKSKTNK